ncbi:PEP-CTERM sorting domain-containing protein [Coleofasciculus sp. FACHB-501]|uniref:PEP-CTERM sorting domain-containing protein n=1 Tax=Cyanophyceae TaxID=3028117 RepID=UPI00168993FB|nr:PEP-CTERM sorting domain-containing protein [Coleofasciculus sp. FACHB-501]MBD1837230.1 PEP-CTERM sorting domain-containing protein [Coleofasciculus sp. FACHB-501]
MAISSILKNLSVAAAGAVLIAVGIAGTAQAKTITVTNNRDSGSYANRTNFNGFEGLQDFDSYRSVYTEDGIKVEQVNGDLNGIASAYQSWGAEGLKSWYANGGDFGFTKITRQDSSDFDNIGLLIGSGWDLSSPITYVYDVLKNGVSLFSGTLFKNTSPNYLGFSGGDFNEIRLAAYYGNNPQQTIGGYQALAIDSIELSDSSRSVPEPGTLIGLVGIASLGASSAMKRKQQQKATVKA